MSAKLLMASHKPSKVCGAETSGPRLTFKWLLPSEGGLGQLVYTDHSYRPLRTTGTDHWASMAAPTGTADSQLPPALPLKLTGRLITGGSSQQTTAVRCSQCGNKWSLNEWTFKKKSCNLQECNFKHWKRLKKVWIWSFCLKLCGFLSLFTGVV